MKLYATDLDQFRYFRDSEMPMEEFVERMTADFQPTYAMRAGTAWHSILEDPPPVDELEFAERNGFQFELALDAEIVLPQLREQRGEKVYHVDGEDVLVSGKYDGRTGPLIVDNKLTGKADVDRYMDSYQWRIYLDIFGAQVFQYNLWLADVDRVPIRILDLSTIRFYRYPEMQADIHAELGDFVRFAKEYLPGFTRPERHETIDEPEPIEA